MKDEDRAGDTRNPVSQPAESLVEILSQKIVGQDAALRFIVPYVEMYKAGLAPEGRPAGVFLLLGPTGTGKTKTVEALAEILHGSEKKVVKIDCGEFQLEQEIAKLIGSPPGYVGHRETRGLLSQDKLSDTTSEGCDLALVLFDEIEKAAPTLTRLLLGILDKGNLRLGDNTDVNFEKTLIFFTSNLGARDMVKEIHPDMGFRVAAPPKWPELKGKLESLALAAVRKMYSPEFVNRIDAVITYQPLDSDAFSAILNHQIDSLQKHVKTRLGSRCFDIEVSPAAHQFLLQKGTSLEYGARELKRTIHRHLTQPLATFVLEGRFEPGSRVIVELHPEGESLRFCPADEREAASAAPTTILVVDDSPEIVTLLSKYLTEHTSWRVITAQSVSEARDLVAKDPPNIAVLDRMLPDGNGVELGAQMKTGSPALQVIIISGLELSGREEEICAECGFRFVHKPFLAEEIKDLIRSCLPRSSMASA